MSITQIPVVKVPKLSVPATPIGPRGPKGWTPQYRGVADGGRKVVELYDWVGGKEPKPATGFIGLAGVVATAAEAIDFAGRSLISVSQNENADLVISYNDDTTQTIPAYFAGVFTAAQQVADDTAAVDLAAIQIESKRQEVVQNAQIAVDAMNEVLTAYGNSQALTNAVIQAGALRDQAASIVGAIQQGVPKGPWNATTNTLPALSATPDPALPDGAFYHVTVAGTGTFAGINFAVGQAMAVGDTLWKAGNQWFRLPFAIANKTITKAKLASGAVGHKQTDFFRPGKNLFNVLDDENLTGFLIDITTGNLTANNSQNTSHFMPVTPGVNYVLSSNTGNGGRFNWYDANKVWISGNQSGLIYFTAPANAAFLRISAFTGSVDWTSILLTVGTVKTAWEAYRAILTSSDGVPIFVNSATSSDVAGMANGLNSSVALTADNIGYTRGLNQFNNADPGVVYGAYISWSTGLPVANASYNGTGFIPVVAGQTYTASYKHQMAWYNADKVYISGSNSTDTSKTQVAPAGAAFVRHTVALASWSAFMLAVGSVELPFEAYRLELDTIGGVKVFAKNPVIINTEPLPVIAPKLYIPRGKELRVYYENLCRYYQTEGRGRVEVTLTGAVIGGRSAALTPANLTPISASVKGYSKDFDLLNTINFTLQPTNETLTTAKNVMNIGDSYTYGSKYVDQLIAGAGTGIAFQGMRLSNGAAVQCRHEGRGGWSLVHYHFTRTDLFTPFWQPQAPYRYFGNTSYWINAVNNHTPIQANYDWANVDPDIRALFSSSTGLLLAPATNDVMYNNGNSTYQRWDGSAWVTVTGLTWSFQFGKYRTLFACPLIDIAHILLGTNDFSAAAPSGFAALYTAFKTRYDTTIASMKADNAAIKVIVGVPVSPARQGQDGVYLAERRKTMFYLLAQNLYTDYGNREGEGIYLADYHSGVDRIYGYGPAQVLPFNHFTGTERDMYTADTVHLANDGYKQMGDIYYGVIQACR